MKKNYGLFIVFIIVVLSVIGYSVFYVFNNISTDEYLFSKDGYALYVNEKDDYKTSSYSFTNGSTYNYKKSNGKIVFNSTDNGNVNVDDSTVIHYADNSLLMLKKVVGIDLSSISNPIILYYNIYKNTEIVAGNGGYSIVSSTGEKINFSNMLIRVNDDKYLFVSDSIRVTVGKDEVVDYGKYAYIEYVDGNVVHIYNNTKSSKTIANELSVVSGDITINMKDKTISKEGKKYITLSNLVIDSDSNIDLIPQETTKLPGITKPNVDTNISGEGSDVENGGSVEEPDNNVDEEVVEEDKVVKQPVYKLVNLVVTPIKVDAEIEITDEDSIITAPTEISIVNNATLEVVYESSVPAGDTSAFISTANLTPDTEYTIYAKTTYSIEGVDYERSFVNKIIRTESIGVSFKKSYVKSNSLAVVVNKEDYSDVTSVVVSLYTKEGARLDYQAVDFSKNNKIEVLFDDLENNTEYNVVMSDVQCDGVTVEEGYSEEKTISTLKLAPFIGKLLYEINKRTSTFKLSIEDVEDPDYGIKGYRYEVFRVDQDMSKELPLVTFDSKNLKAIDVNVDENKLNRGTAYTYRVVIEFYDNEKTIEYIKELGSTMQLDGVEYPTIRFDETYVTWEQINGAIVINDKYDTIVGDNFRVVYKNSVEEYKTYTIMSSTTEETIPIAINDLRANETYTFQVYADVNLKDGNKTIDEAYIGSVIVKTKEPQHLQALYTANLDYSNAFAINMKLSNLPNQDASLEASTISGMTLTLYQGSNAGGQTEIWKKVVDLDDSSYISTIKQEFYDTQKLLTPSFFGALNGDFTQKTYTLKVSDVYDYTKFKNQIIIDNDTFSFNINSYVPDVPTDSDDAIKVTKILNKNAEVFGLEMDENLVPNAVVGYNVVSNYPNDAMNALNLIYHVWIYNPTTKKYEVIPSLDRVLPYDADGNVSNAVFEVGYGTNNNIFDTDMLRRGNKYYFTYEVELDLDGDGVKEPINYPGIHGEDIVLKSPELSIPKESPLYEIYPSSSTAVSATWKYRIKDVDLVFENSKLYAFVGNNANPASSPDITLNSDQFQAVTFGSLKSGDVYSIKSYTRPLKFENAKYITLPSQYLQPITSSLGLKYDAEVDANTLIIRLLDIEDKEDLLNKISSVDVTLTPLNKNNLDVINVNGLTLNNGTVFINLIDYPQYMNVELRVDMKAYFDSGNTGFDVPSNLKAVQVLTNNEFGTYFTILNNKVEQNGTVEGSEFISTFDPEANFIKITNRNNQSVDMEFSIDQRGVLYDGNTITYKELKEENLASDNKIVTFNMLIPSISLLDKKTNKLTITPLLTSAMFNTTIKLVEGVKLQNNHICVELYETDTNGMNAFKVREMCNTPENLKSFTLENLTPQKNYMVKFYTKINTSGNIYTKYYLYDEDSNVLEQQYHFTTLSNVGIDNINTTFIINSYEEKQVILDYSLNNIMGFNFIKYNLYEYVEGEFELVDVSIPNSELFSYAMSIPLDAKPGNDYGFSYGKTYKIEIIPIGIYTLNGENIELDLGSKQHIFTLDEYKDPQINITGSRTDNSISFRVNIKDTSKVIVDNKYSVKLKRVSDDTTLFEKKLVNIDLTSDKYTFAKDEYDLRDGESYMLIVSYYGDFENTGKNLKYKDKTRSERFGNYVSLGAVSATGNNTDSSAINIVFSDSYLLESIKKISYTVSSPTTDFFSAGTTDFNLSYNSDTNIYIYKLKLDTTNNFNAGNVYTVTMDFFDEKGKLLIDHEVSYYYAVNLGGGE